MFSGNLLELGQTKLLKAQQSILVLIHKIFSDKSMEKKELCRCSQHQIIFDTGVTEEKIQK